MRRTVANTRAAMTHIAMRLRVAVLAAGLVAPVVLPGVAQAAQEAPTPPDVDFSFKGVFGTYDRDQLQRGFQVYNQVCAACHALSLVYYRNLVQIGLSPDQVAAIAAEKTVMDGPNDEGDMFERPARLSDKFASPFANENAARASNNGAYPVDLSLITKARANGSNYLHGLLVGYKEPPPDVTVEEGRYYNEYYPGHLIAMPPPLNEGAVTYPEGMTASVENMAKDVSAFLTFAADPHMEDRKRMGVKVILFLIVLTAMLYAVKRKVWADVH